MGARITAEITTVYRGGKRRYFRAGSAARAEAWARIVAKYPCECERAEYADFRCVYPGYCCPRHDIDGDEYARIQKLAKRYARVILRGFRRSLITEGE